VSREFAILADRTSPVVTWLRALAAQAYRECGGPGVGAIGMCLTGGFALAMAVEPAVLAPVVSQPGLPAPLTAKKRAAVGLDPADLAQVKARTHRGGLCVLGLRFSAERADIARERGELATNPELDLGELAAIYQRRGLDEKLARTVAGRLMAVDPLAAHVRDELGLTLELLARPVQAAVVSAVNFSVGAVLPLLAVVFAPASVRILAVAGVALVVLGVLGGVGGRLGGASSWRGAGRVLVGGGLAMAATAVIGRLVGAVGL
jgi:VIT1/CCC1 family predicted Fe2+/Mn2+ transporter